MKKILSIAITSVLLSTAFSSTAGEFCEEIAFQVPIAWEVEKEYRKVCSYGTEGILFDGLYSYTFHGEGTSTTPWSSTNDGVCSQRGGVTISYVNQTDPSIYKPREAGTGSLYNVQTESKVVSRTPVEWETKIIWRDRNGNECRPYIN